MNLSSGRLRCLQALAFGKLRFKPEEKDRFVSSVVPGKQSFHDLTNDEADRVIDELKRRAGQTPMRPLARDRRRARAGAGTGDIALLITPAQRQRLGELQAELVVSGVGRAYVEGVFERACGRRKPVTATEAEHAIEALKAVADRVAGGWRPQSQAE